MRKTITLIFALLAILIFACSCGATDSNLSASVIAGSDTGEYLTGCYARVDGVEGDCSDARHEKWIDVIDFNLGTKYDQSSLNGVIEPLVIVHKLDSATPHFQHACVNGNIFTTVKLDKTTRTAGTEKTTFLVTIKNARIVSAEITSDANGDLIETLKFNYENATIEYTPIKPDGTSGNTSTDTISNR